MKMSDETSPAGKNHNKYRKEKPWDDENVDHWKIEEWKPEFMSGPMLEESSFATLFPRYREAYLREKWPSITKLLKKEGIACELNLLEGSMTVKTTRKTTDPYIILKARDLIKLLARSMQVEQAVKILQDGMHCDIIKIGGLLRNKERFVKRRQRLLGPSGQTLKAVELLTKCYILIQGNTVAAMGGIQGLKQVRKIVVDCIQNNYHPIYNIKALMIKRELAKDPELANEDWSRFLPKFRKRKPRSEGDGSSKGAAVKKKRKIKAKKEYTPFPPAQTPSKLDLQLESGEYFLSEQQRLEKKRQEKKQKLEKKIKARENRRNKSFTAPKDPNERKRGNPKPKEDFAKVVDNLKRNSNKRSRRKQ